MWMAKKPIRICSNEDCNEIHYAKGLCKYHYEHTAERQAKIKALKSSSKYKQSQKDYQSRLEVKAKIKERRERPEVKAKRKSKESTIRLKVLNHYSKKLSKSNIPCCNCCGENFHIDFLALDHIKGRKAMNSEPELVRLGYHSKKTGLRLYEWIIENNFPKGFQILCHNCNFAKGLTNNNKCPHQNHT